MARFIRIRAQSWNGRICLRAEFYGCNAGKTVTTFVLFRVSYLQKECRNDSINQEEEITFTTPEDYNFRAAKPQFNCV